MRNIYIERMIEEATRDERKHKLWIRIITAVEIAWLILLVCIAVALFDVVTSMAATPYIDGATGEWVMAEISTQDNAIDIQEAPPINNISKALDALDDGFIYIEDCPLNEEQQRTVYHWWTEVGGLDYATGLALADKETNGSFNVSALNKRSHDYGLFQINRASWFRHMQRELGIDSMDDLREDLALCTQAAVIVYGDCVRMYGDTERAIVAYNKGPTSIRSNGYSRDVLARKAKWQQALGAK